MDNKFEVDCDMFSEDEYCPECGNMDNDSSGFCSLCGCIWEIKNRKKIVRKHGKFAGKL